MKYLIIGTVNILGNTVQSLVRRINKEWGFEFLGGLYPGMHLVLQGPYTKWQLPPRNLGIKMEGQYFPPCSLCIGGLHHTFTLPFYIRNVKNINTSLKASSTDFPNFKFLIFFALIIYFYSEKY